METGLTRRDGNLRDTRDVATLPANLHFPFHVESETVTVSSGSAVQSTKVLRRAHPANRKMKVKKIFRASRGLIDATPPPLCTAFGSGRTTQK